MGDFLGGWSQTGEATATTMFGNWKSGRGGTTVTFVFALLPGL